MLKNALANKIISNHQQIKFEYKRKNIHDNIFNNNKIKIIRHQYLDY